MDDRHERPDARPRILVAEDQYAIALSMEMLLDDLGYRVLGPVARVEEALALLGETMPDGAILDLNLHSQRITPVARQLRAMNVPFILLTGYSKLLPEDAELADAPLLGKPAHTDEIAAALRALLAPGGAGAKTGEGASTK